MKHQIIDRIYSIFSKEINKSNTSFTRIEDIENYLIDQIKAHPVAGYIATFDHYKHTSNLPGGMIPSYIKSSINVLCCFGMAIPSPEYMGVKPMSIAVVETEDAFILSFEQAPAPSVQKAIQSWIEGVENR